LCRWSFSDSPVVDDRDYTDRRFTADDPDRDGLKLCQERGNAFFEDYGVAVQVLDISAAEGFTFTPEFRVPALMGLLDTLEDLLKPFPESFFAGLEEGKLTLLLVDSITDAQGNNRNSLSYWENGTGRIVLTGDGDIRLNFYTALSYVLEAHIYANSLAFDEWSKLNPKGFAYDNAFDLYADRTDSPWLEGEERAFVDSYSMTFPREDRARIFAYAMMDDQEAVFASPTMQAKLRQLCKAIREAFDWEKTEESFPWEQYLAQ